MKIALIAPPLKHLYLPQMDEPLHLAYLGAQLTNDHDLSLIDGLGQSLDTRQIMDRLASMAPDLVGISLTFTGAYAGVLDLCRAIRSDLPGTVTVLGGNTATFRADELAGMDIVDVVVRGEGDLTFPALARAIEQRTPLSQVSGISFLHQGKLIHTPDRPLVRDLDTLPFPARHLLPEETPYLKTVLTARGCPYGCAYCSAAAFWNRRYRKRSVDNIMAEIEAMDLNCEDSFFFQDDCFTLNRDRVTEICRRLEQLQSGVFWGCTGRIETVDARLLETLSRAGCKAMFFGVESGSPKVLKTLGRRYTPDDVKAVYTHCIQNGIRPKFSFIVGLPGETKEDIDKTYDLIRQLEGVECGSHMLTPFPGTPITEAPDTFGIRIHEHGIQDLDINTACYLNTDCLGTEEIEEAYRTAIGYGMKTLRRTRALNRILAQGQQAGP